MNLIGLKSIVAGKNPQVSPRFPFFFLQPTPRKTIAPVGRSAILGELRRLPVLGSARAGKRLYVLSSAAALNTLREIALLRELVFRQVGEGTGGTMDSDKFDHHYHHLILWDEEEQEIVGAYRLGLGQEIIRERGVKGFYSSTLFDFSSSFHDLLPRTVELGRSFVQPKYWRSNALDHLWHGLGAFMLRHSEVEYLFGAVSLSNAYAEPARRMLVHFYQKWYGEASRLASAKFPLNLLPDQQEEMSRLFCAGTPAEDFLRLKQVLKSMHFSVPVLYRHYTDLCRPGGVRFLDFSVDRNFSNGIDGLMLLHLGSLKPEKRQRYLNASHNGPA